MGRRKKEQIVQIDQVEIKKEMIDYESLPPIRIWNSISGYQFIKFHYLLKDILFNTSNKYKFIEYMRDRKIDFYQTEITRDEMMNVIKIIKKNKLKVEILTN